MDAKGTMKGNIGGSRLTNLSSAVTNSHPSLSANAK